MNTLRMFTGSTTWNSLKCFTLSPQCLNRINSKTAWSPLTSPLFSPHFKFFLAAPAVPIPDRKVHTLPRWHGISSFGRPLWGTPPLCGRSRWSWWPHWSGCAPRPGLQCSPLSLLQEASFAWKIRHSHATTQTWERTERDVCPSCTLPT